MTDSVLHTCTLRLIGLSGAGSGRRWRPCLLGIDNAGMVPTSDIFARRALLLRVSEVDDSHLSSLDRYGLEHLEERMKYVDIIRQHGGECQETVCIMPTRRIARGAPWHLAHDHARGGRHDYLGPAHPECNQYEALVRGVAWPGSPTAEQLLEAVNSPDHGLVLGSTPRACVSCFLFTPLNDDGVCDECAND